VVSEAIKMLNDSIKGNFAKIKSFNAMKLSSLLFSMMMMIVETSGLRDYWRTDKGSHYFCRHIWQRSALNLHRHYFRALKVNKYFPNRRRRFG